MRLKQWIGIMEEIAPSRLAMEEDNVGLLIGTDKDDILKVLVALDLTVSVAKEAISEGVDLVLTHHPVFFHPIQQILPEDPSTAAAYLLIKNGIGLFAAHTNLDACAGGVNDAIAQLLEMKEVSPLRDDGIGRIGYLKEPVLFSAFINKCNDIFHTKVTCTDVNDRMISLVGVVGGAGGDMVIDAVNRGCDAFLTGEMRHHEAIDACYYDIPCVVAGHYQTEVVVLKKLISRLQQYGNSVEYIESKKGKAPLITL